MKYRIINVYFGYDEVGTIEIRTARDGMTTFSPRPEFSYYDFSYEGQYNLLVEQINLFENTLEQFFPYTEKNAYGKRYLRFKATRIEILRKLKEVEKRRKG